MEICSYFIIIDLATSNYDLYTKNGVVKFFGRSIAVLDTLVAKILIIL